MPATQRGRIAWSLALTAAVAAGAVHGCTPTDALDGWPAQLVARSPTNQTALTGFAVNDGPAVLLLDSDGRPITAVPVSFDPIAGSTAFTPTVATTGSDGIAVLGGWTADASVNRVRASIPAPFRVPPVEFQATGVAAAYRIDVGYLTAVSSGRQATFAAAAARWQQLIYGDVADLQLNPPIPADLCFPGQPAIGGLLDDVLIHVILDSIDGPGQILGGAAPCFVRTAGRLPLHGVMIFDTADVAALELTGLFDDVILHEMGHVLGFGTIWEPPNLNLLTGGGGPDPFFNGLHARAAFDRVGGQGYTGGARVPVENSGGAGTVDSHWRESVFGPELMTGFVNSGVTNPLSVVTVASMRDEAYLVNYAAADPYAHPFTAARGAPTPGVLAGPMIPLGDDILRFPIHAVDERGRITVLRRP